MKIVAFGLEPDGKRLFGSQDEDEVARALLSALKREAPVMRRRSQATDRGFRLRGEVKRRVVDVGDPQAVGWSFLIAHDDPQRTEIERILRPLAMHRGMRNPSAPIMFGGGAEETWEDWLQDAYYGFEGVQVPQYVLMVGEPDRIPFKLQSLLGTVASVGRIAFGRLDDLDHYVQKIIRLETVSSPVVHRRVMLFGPDQANEEDPTFFSRKYMVEPLVSRIRDDLHFEATALVGGAATKQGLVAMLRGASPALVYTASHGLAVATSKPELQARYNGAICCSTEGAPGLDALFSADDVPSGEPFLEGAVVFQFACFGYGTPAESDYLHWLRGVPKRYADADFIAALPKRLLAHPRGPIAFIGHLDTAFLHGFANPDDPPLGNRWDKRIEPFVHAVDRLLGVQPSGLAMEDMSRRLILANQVLMNYYDRQRRRTLDWSSVEGRRLVDNWIFRSDAQNYMIFGDPAARLRIPEA